MKLFGLLIGAALIGACGGGDAFSAQACTPGVTQECACPGGAKGAQACRDDGTGYETCQCGGGSGSGGSAGSGGNAGAAGVAGVAGVGGAAGAAGVGTAGAAPGDGGPGMPPSNCTSGVMWTGGNSRADTMTPGRACQACHAQSTSAPQFTMAGTIYATATEADDCNGAAIGAVTIMTMDGADLFRIPANAAGNFYTSKTFPSPYRVRVTIGTKSTVKRNDVASPDCNSCHGPTNRIHL